MTIDEAIKHCEEVADINENIAENTDYDNWMDIVSCQKCAEEHRQLAEWLKELEWWRSRKHACYTCKFYELSIDCEPCLSCRDKYNDKWECGYER